MERLTKRYNERTGTYEYIDAFSGAGTFDSIMKGITFNFVKETAKNVGGRALEAAVDRVGNLVGELAFKKAISALNKPPKQVESIIYKKNEFDYEESSKLLGLKDSKESFKPLENIFMKELNKNSHNLTSPENLNTVLKNYIMVIGHQIKNLK